MSFLKNKFKIGKQYIFKVMLQMYLPYPHERGPTTEYRPTPHFGLNLLLRSNVYSNMRPRVAALENAAQMAGYED